MTDGSWFGALALAVWLPFAVGPAEPDEPRFPVAGDTSYGEFHHDYPATDIFADCGAPVLAPVSGVLLEVTRRDRWDAASDRGADRGGRSVSLLGEDGVRYYASHLSTVAGWVRPGGVVAAGERLGQVGRTGSAAGTPCHVHFGVSHPCRLTGDWWVRRGVVAPYPLLEAWAREAPRNARRGVDAWQARVGCAGPP